MYNFKTLNYFCFAQSGLRIEAEITEYEIQDIYILKIYNTDIPIKILPIWTWYWMLLEKLIHILNERMQLTLPTVQTQKKSRWDRH